MPCDCYGKRNAQCYSHRMPKQNTHFEDRWVTVLISASADRQFQLWPRVTLNHVSIMYVTPESQPVRNGTARFPAASWFELTEIVWDPAEMLWLPRSLVSYSWPLTCQTHVLRAWWGAQNSTQASITLLPLGFDLYSSDIQPMAQEDGLKFNTQLLH